MLEETKIKVITFLILVISINLPCLAKTNHQRLGEKPLIQRSKECGPKEHNTKTFIKYIISPIQYCLGVLESFGKIEAERNRIRDLKYLQLEKEMREKAESIGL